MLDVCIANLMPLSLHILLSQGRQEYILRARQIKIVQKTLKETLTWNNGAVAGCPIKLREIDWLLNYTPKKMLKCDFIDFMQSISKCGWMCRQ